MRAFRFVAFFSMMAAATAACVGDEPSPGGAPNPGVDAGGSPDSSSTTDSGGTTTDSSTTDTGTDAAPIKRLVFVTSAQLAPTFASASDPWTAGDAICATEATANGLGGTFVAWLSYKNQTSTSFNAASRIGDAPYYLPVNAAEGGAPVLAFETKTELFTTGPRVPFDRLPNGTVVPTDSTANTYVWTGTDQSGNATGDDCTRWTTAAPDGGSSPTAMSGNAQKYTTPTAKDWTAFGQRLCDHLSRIYCFQK